ncbi:MAG: hypothetical protein GY734_07820 [Herbaspirillum sp.]|nr:hypothetical protein [Herbaspirillum sp.]
MFLLLFSELRFGNAAGAELPALRVKFRQKGCDTEQCCNAAVCFRQSFLKIKEGEMRKLSVLLLCLAVIARFSVPAFSLTVIPADSAEALAYSLAGPGITISDVSFTGNLAAAGYFSDGPAETGLEKGTVLTTGFASNLNGTSNTSDEMTGVNNTAGDPDLDAMIPGYSTFDAAVLSFDFIPSGDTLKFSCIFGSEEYDEYADSDYNDVFGIFIDSVNYALVPETDTPVSVSSINSTSYSEYYNDNDAFKSFGGSRNLTLILLNMTVLQMS